MSLRGRLVLIVLVLAAIGILVLDAVSYLALRTYLLDRVDEQVEAAAEAGSQLLGELSPGELDGSRPLPLGPNGGAPEPPDLDPDERPPPEGPGPAQLPAGAVVEVRNADGEVLRSRNLAFGPRGATPELGSEVPDATPGQVTVGSVTSAQGETEYRVATAEISGSSRSVVVAIPLTDVDSTLGRLLVILAVVTGVVLAAAAVLAWWVVWIGLKPLRRIETTALEIAAGDMSKRVEVGSEGTEVGRLGSAFNEMVEQIVAALKAREASEEQLRRFLADASHELRTPLASIRGYSELFRLGATDDPEQLEIAMGRIESESVRMGALVDDLLALARADEQRALTPEPVQIDELVAEVVADARARAPERVIDLAVERPLAALDADPEQLRRAVSNLLTNAIVHTPPGTPVDVSVAEGAGIVSVVVRDYGPGIEPGGEERVFERFWRAGADEGRARRSGAGLGLAIVDAVARAHHGTASARNGRGGGAEFRIDLPRRG
ncbi:HAMP domain-containing histidine kinase [Thermoleophilia bacterium SCSIO 60948]|nr:HAMP domain-containing histidine kinase [Thermoleophilia bacterium SCSIO 60948]